MTNSVSKSLYKRECLICNKTEMAWHDTSGQVHAVVRNNDSSPTYMKDIYFDNGVKMRIPFDEVNDLIPGMQFVKTKTLTRQLSVFEKRLSNL